MMLIKIIKKIICKIFGCKYPMTFVQNVKCLRCGERPFNK